MRWPRTLTEDQTLDSMLAGMSIARFGDGELGIALGGGNATHRPNMKLAQEYREILKRPHENCLVAIPTMDPRGPKYPNWVNSRDRWAQILDLDRTYASVFVGQAVSAPWIQNDEYIRKFRSLWAGKRVGLISHDTGGLHQLTRTDNVKPVNIVCPEFEAYDAIDSLEQQCLEATCDIYLMAAGPMATVLAHRLAGHGKHAIDMGRGVGVVLRHPLPDYPA